MRDDAGLEQKDDTYYTRSEKEEDFFYDSRRQFSAYASLATRRPQNNA